MKYLNENQLYNLRYSQWCINGERYGFPVDLFVCLSKFAPEGYPRFLLFRNGYDKDNFDTIPITIGDNPVLLSQKEIKISESDYLKIRDWIVLHQLEITILMDGHISFLEFLENTSQGEHIEVEIEDELLAPLKGIKQMRRLDSDYISYLLEYYTFYHKHHYSYFNVDVAIPDVPYNEFEKCPLLVLIGNGYTSVEEYKWDYIALTLAEHPQIVSTTPIAVSLSDIERVSGWISKNRFLLKDVAMQKVDSSFVAKSTGLQK